MSGSISADGVTRGEMDAGAPASADVTSDELPPPKVLELRVHGVNNTTPAALLDVPADSVELKSGDKLGSFWRSTATPARMKHGYVPPEIMREAYSWGGMVRTTPQVGGGGTTAKLAAFGARLVYALILPFSIGNAVVWSRRITKATDSTGRKVWIAITAGAARVFGLILTLLFTTTLITLAIDVAALQCGADAARCEPLKTVFEPMAGWSPGQRVALLALIPIVAIGALWAMSAISRLRYDVLPGMEDNTDEPSDDDRRPKEQDDADAAEGVAAGPSWIETTPSKQPDGQQPPALLPPTAVLSVPGFWSNRVTRYLARVHLAAATALVAVFCALQGSLGWRASCTGWWFFECTPDAGDDMWFGTFAGMAVLAILLLAVAVVLVAALPTMTIRPVEEGRWKWPDWMTKTLLAVSLVVLAAILLTLAFLPTDGVLASSSGPDRLYGAGTAPLVLTILGGVLALSGLFWRPAANRWQAAWFGCAPAVFMTLALALAVASSAITVVMVGDWLNGSQGPTNLLGWTEGDSSSTLDLQIPPTYVALGATLLVAVVASLLIVVAIAFLRPRDVTARAEAWDAPPKNPIKIPAGGVLPPTSAALEDRIQSKRRSAARLHLVEPAVGVIATMLGIGLVAGVLWTCWSTFTEDELWSVGGLVPEFWVNLLDVGMLGLTAVGAILVGVLAAGAGSSGTRPLGIVWDIACYLPQTGHPFGPPCYAERAVPEIAGRLNSWIRKDEKERYAVLAAHSMGGVLAISSIGLLASTPSTREKLSRISLLTFGIQLRTFFGRMLPELLGPEVLGIQPARRPRLWGRDPWQKDFHAQGSVTPLPRYKKSPETPAVGLLDGTLVSAPDDAGTPVRWVSLWRASDFLGFPVMSTATGATDATWGNEVDRYAEELDTTGYMVAVGTHGEYYRTMSYQKALAQLARIDDTSVAAE